MTVLTPRATTADLVRGVVVAVLAVAQLVASGLGGSGALGEPIGEVARSYATPLLAASWAFAIWGLIYVGFLAYAVYQLLPSQRARSVHRWTGWWLAASAVANPLWILTFGSRHILLAEVLIIALLVILALVFGRLSHEPAEGLVERIVFRGTVAVYTGWVSLATALGTAATGVRIGLPGDGALADVAAIVVLLVVAVIASAVVNAGTAVVGYAAAVVWALAGVAVAGPPVPVIITAVVAMVVVAATTIRRVSRSVRPAVLAWG
ncbi:MAG: hypothetical protein OJJ54_15170 [Pseudonocardia sp.]|nr:hypothetical protein [Pseudonocardia sp.]